MIKPRINPVLLEAPQYVPGRDVEEVKAEFGLSEVIKMASNESPIGSSPLAISAVQNMLGSIHRYPGKMERTLRRKIAVSLGAGFNEQNILLGNGGTDVLRMITQAFVFDGGNTIMSRTTFPMYHTLTKVFGGVPHQINPLPDYGHDLEGMLAQIDEDTRLVFLCSPNNPTGHTISQMEADEFMARIPPHVVVVFDESYFDFVTAPDYADSLAYILAGRNALTLRSFSKSAGLANLRIGYLVGPVSLISYIRHIQLPFHVNDVALTAAAASLADYDYLTRHQQAVWAGRDYLFAAINELGLHCLPSQTNFVTIVNSPLSADSLVEALLYKGFIVRAMTAFGLSNGVRISTGTLAQNKKFIAALQEVLYEAGAIDQPIKDGGNLLFLREKV